MLSISYDSTFDGFLSVVFEVYRQRLQVGEILPDRAQAQATDLFMQPFKVETSDESARRLKRAIVNAAGLEILNLLNIVFRSEEAGIEMKMLAYLRKLFAGIDPNYAKNPTSKEMLPLYMIAQSVRREAGDMLGMVRFDKLSDGTYFAEIEPKYDIVELMTAHFRGRFANERWAIYDSKRDYGVYYDGRSAQMVTVPSIEAVRAGMPPDELSQLWRDYYNIIAIKERENPKLLRRCLPVRYWKHLTERKGLQGVSPSVFGAMAGAKTQQIRSKNPQDQPFMVALPSDVAKMNASQRVLA